jgi:phosphonopyruvate decarboxylase
MGGITRELFDLMGIPWKLLPATCEEAVAVLDEASDQMRLRRTPFALIVRKGSFAISPHSDLHGGTSRVAAPSEPAETGAAMEPDAALMTVQSSVRPEDVIIATTGYTGRALYALGDRSNQLYMVGSMGCASSLGLGLAKAQPQRRVVVLDGDGAFLMRMGAAAVLAHERPANLTHIVLDNGVHDSTGAQSTVSRSMNLAGVAEACGYPRARRIHRPRDLAAELRSPARDLTFLHVPTEPRNDRTLPRPRLSPEALAERFRNWMNEPCMETI